MESSPLCSECNSHLQLMSQLQGGEEVVIGTIWSIRRSSSTVIIFMLGFIADAITLHLGADNGMRISPPHWLCSFNSWNEQLMQRHRGDGLFICYCSTPQMKTGRRWEVQYTDWETPLVCEGYKGLMIWWVSTFHSHCCTGWHVPSLIWVSHTQTKRLLMNPLLRGVPNKCTVSSCWFDRVTSCFTEWNICPLFWWCCSWFEGLRLPETRCDKCCIKNYFERQLNGIFLMSCN